MKRNSRGWQLIIRARLCTQNGTISLCPNPYVTPITDLQSDVQRNSGQLPRMLRTRESESVAGK